MIWLQISFRVCPGSGLYFRVRAGFGPEIVYNSVRDSAQNCKNTCGAAIAPQVPTSALVLNNSKPPSRPSRENHRKANNGNAWWLRISSRFTWEEVRRQPKSLKHAQLLSGWGWLFQMKALVIQRRFLACGEWNGSINQSVLFRGTTTWPGFGLNEIICKKSRFLIWSNLSLYSLYYVKACNEFSRPTLRHCTTAGNTASFDEDSQRGESLATLCPIWPAQDLNLRPPVPETNEFLPNHLANSEWLIWFTKC